jgi:hypothetical protein
MILYINQILYIKYIYILYNNTMERDLFTVVLCILLFCLVMNIYYRYEEGFDDSINDTPLQSSDTCGSNQNLVCSCKSTAPTYDEQKLPVVQGQTDGPVEVAGVKHIHTITANDRLEENALGIIHEGESTKSRSQSGGLDNPIILWYTGRNLLGEMELEEIHELLSRGSSIRAPTINKKVWPMTGGTSNLTLDEQLGALALGYRQSSWDGNEPPPHLGWGGGPVTEANWRELSYLQRSGAMALGWTHSTWDDGPEPASSNKDWEVLPELTNDEMIAAEELGYDADSWNNETGCPQCGINDWNTSLTNEQRVNWSILGYDEGLWSIFNNKEYLIDYIIENKSSYEINAKNKNAYSASDENRILFINEIREQLIQPGEEFLCRGADNSRHINITTLPHQDWPSGAARTCENVIDEGDDQRAPRCANNCDGCYAKYGDTYYTCKDFPEEDSTGGRRVCERDVECVINRSTLSDESFNDSIDEINLQDFIGWEKVTHDMQVIVNDGHPDVGAGADAVDMVGQQIYLDTRIRVGPAENTAEATAEGTGRIEAGRGLVDSRNLHVHPLRDYNHIVGGDIKIFLQTIPDKDAVATANSGWHDFILTNEELHGRTVVNVANLYEELESLNNEQSGLEQGLRTLETDERITEIINSKGNIQENLDQRVFRLSYALYEWKLISPDVFLYLPFNNTFKEQLEAIRNKDAMMRNIITHKGSIGHYFYVDLDSRTYIERQQDDSGGHSFPSVKILITLSKKVVEHYGNYIHRIENSIKRIFKNMLPGNTEIQKLIQRTIIGRNATSRNVQRGTGFCDDGRRTPAFWRNCNSQLSWETKFTGELYKKSKWRVDIYSMIYDDVPKISGWDLVFQNYWVHHIPTDTYTFNEDIEAQRLLGVKAGKKMLSYVEELICIPGLDEEYDQSERARGPSTSMIHAGTLVHELGHLIHSNLPEEYNLIIDSLYKKYYVAQCGKNADPSNDVCDSAREAGEGYVNICESANAMIDSNQIKGGCRAVKNISSGIESAGENRSHSFPAGIVVSTKGAICEKPWYQCTNEREFFAVATTVWFYGEMDLDSRSWRESFSRENMRTLQYFSTSHNGETITLYELMTKIYGPPSLCDPNLDEDDIDDEYRDVCYCDLY